MSDIEASDLPAPLVRTEKVWFCSKDGMNYVSPRCGQGGTHRLVTVTTTVVVTEGWGWRRRKVTDGKGWTHEEAKRHTLAERLHERCRIYGGRTCSEKGLPGDEWCERCLAVRVLSDAVDELESIVAYVPDYFRGKWGYDESIAAIKGFMVEGERER